MVMEHNLDRQYSISFLLPVYNVESYLERCINPIIYAMKRCDFMLR